jgi:hypothetical protein
MAKSTQSSVGDEQPVVGAALAEGETAPKPKALPGAATGALGPTDPDAIARRFQPISALFGGVGGDNAEVLGKDVLELGTVKWRLSNFHFGHISLHDTLADAQQAAIYHAHTRHPGALDRDTNPTTWEIEPVIQLTVKDILTQPTPVGSRVKPKTRD